MKGKIMYAWFDGEKWNEVANGTEIRKLAAEGKITPTTLIRVRDGKVGPAGKIQGLVFRVHVVPLPTEKEKRFSLSVKMAFGFGILMLISGLFLGFFTNFAGKEIRKFSQQKTEVVQIKQDKEQSPIVPETRKQDQTSENAGNVATNVPKEKQDETAPFQPDVQYMGPNFSSVPFAKKEELTTLKALPDFQKYKKIEDENKDEEESEVPSRTLPVILPIAEEDRAKIDVRLREFLFFLNHQREELIDGQSKLPAKVVISGYSDFEILNWYVIDINEKNEDDEYDFLRRIVKIGGTLKYNSPETTEVNFMTQIIAVQRKNSNVCYCIPHLFIFKDTPGEIVRVFATSNKVFEYDYTRLFFLSKMTRMELPKTFPKIINNSKDWQNYLTFLKNRK
ncbi:MAG: hypothetical protein FWC50_02455 [Planctomycetaceae bacterium]|nr:hypothetical protein [Planctomycetaceae bacterium]